MIGLGALGTTLCAMPASAAINSEVVVSLKQKKSSANNDLDLVQRAQQGDTEAYRYLVERYQSKAFSVALGVIGNKNDAEDIVQEAFLKAYKNLGRFKGKSSFYTWLYRIVTNLAIDYSRKKYRKTEVSVGQMVSSDCDSKDLLDTLNSLFGEDLRDNPERYIVRDEIRTGLNRAMEKLSPEHKAVVYLREVDGLSYEEISDIVGCSKGTVMSRLHHARKNLKVFLSALYENYV